MYVWREKRNGTIGEERQKIKNGEKNIITVMITPLYPIRKL